MNMKISAMEDPSVRRLYISIAIISAIFISVTSLYGLIEAVRGYLTDSIITVGENLVDIEWPLPYFAKPVTYLSFSLVAFWYSITHIYHKKFVEISQLKRSFLIFFSLIVAFGSGYEVLYNFTVWGALMSAEAFSGILNPDFLNIAYPNPKTPWNLVFATKLFIALFVISLHSLYILKTNEPKK